MDGKSIVSAVSLFKKFNQSTLLDAREDCVEEREGVRFSLLSYNAHAAVDGCVRVQARFARPISGGTVPAVLFLPDVKQTVDEDLFRYFCKRGYAVLVPDYAGYLTGDEALPHYRPEPENGESTEGLETDEKNSVADTTQTAESPESVETEAEEKAERTWQNAEVRTRYPRSLAYGNYAFARGLRDLEFLEAENTTGFEWTYVAFASVRYLKERKDVGEVGVVGVRVGGELAWHVMLSSDVKCGVPINAAGWYSFRHIPKFGDDIAHNLSDDRHRYIAACEAQSYAPYVKCPVLMLCALHDKMFDPDRAYDTYSRIGYAEGNALHYSPIGGDCIGPDGLVDLQLFLEKNLKGREIYLPDTLNIKMKESPDGLQILVESDEEGLLEEAGVFYAEGDVNGRSIYRDWRQVYKTEDRQVQNGQFRCLVKPYAGATAAFAFAYAKYINGFCVMSKITSRRLNGDPSAVRNRVLCGSGETDCFRVLRYRDEAIGGVFLEKEILPDTSVGYGGIVGAYAKGGMRSYKVNAPEFAPKENDLLQFEGYSAQTQELRVVAETSGEDAQRYVCIVPVRGGGKWKRILLRPAEFKGVTTGRPLKSFSLVRALEFACDGEEKEFAITDVLWL